VHTLVFKLVESSDFEAFRPVGATRCTDFYVRFHPCVCGFITCTLVFNMFAS